MPTSGISRRVSAISRFMSSMLTGQAHSGSGSCGMQGGRGRRQSGPTPKLGGSSSTWVPPTPVRQYSRAASSAICAGSWP